MSEIKVHYKNEVYISIECSDVSTLYEISDYFTFEVPGAKFTPKFRSRIWDGKIRLFSIHTKQLYFGLLDDLKKFAQERNYTIILDDKLKTFKKALSKEDFISYVKSLNIHSKSKKIEPYDYQLNAAHYSIENNRCVIKSPTGSGKSLIIYILTKWYLDKVLKPSEKVLIVVPTLGLITQMKSDFVDYSTEHDSTFGDNCHCIYSGESKITKSSVVISTWQSLYKQPENYFKDIGCVIVDECFSPDTEILTPNGYVKISDLKIGDNIINVDASNKSKIDTIINIHKNMINSMSEKMYELEFDNGAKIKVTGNHKLLTKNRGWVRADEITEEDEMEVPE